MFGTNLDVFSSNFQSAKGFQMLLTSDFVARMDLMCSELEVSLPLAYPSTIYKHFSLLKPFIKGEQNSPWELRLLNKIPMQSTQMAIF